jgi:hypothetical protein
VSFALIMASLEDYDEFGNYIGADLDSDDEEGMEDVQQEAPQQQPLEGFEDEAMQTDQAGALIEVEGAYSCRETVSRFKTRPQSLHTMLSSCTRINSTIPALPKYMGRVSRRLCRRKMLNR